MKLRTTLLMAAAAMAISASCMAAPSMKDFNVVSIPYGMSRQEFCETKMQGWADRVEAGESLQTISHEVDKIYVRGDNRIAYYDEWVSLDKEDQRAFARVGMARLGAPEEWAAALAAGNGEDPDGPGEE